MKKKNVIKNLTKYALVLGILFIGRSAYAIDFLGDLHTATVSAAATIKLIVAVICWIFLTVGLGIIIYTMVTDSQRSKFAIISFVGAGLILTVGYTTGLL